MYGATLTPLDFAPIGEQLDPTLKLHWDATQSVYNITGPAGTFTRASIARKFNDLGVLTQTAIDELRTDNHRYTGSAWENVGAWGEGQATNLATRSEDLSDAAWVKTRASVTANTVVSPSGALTADKVISDSTLAATHAIQSSAVSFTSGTSYTFSIFVKPAEYSRCSIILSSSAFPVNSGANFILTGNGSVGSQGAGATGSRIDKVGDFYRVTVTAVANATSSQRALFFLDDGTGGLNPVFNGDGTSGLFAWGAQLETGSIATSYIATTSAAVPRSADVWTLSGSDFASVYNQTEGTLVLECSTPAVGINPIVSFDDNTANKRISIFTSGTDLRMLVVDGGSTVVDMSLGTIVANTQFKLAVRLKANDIASSLNGAAVVTDTSVTLPTVDRMRIGHNQAGAYGSLELKSHKVYNTGKANSFLQAVTA